MNSEQLAQRGEELYSNLLASMAALERATGVPGGELYAAFLHGQIEGLAQALRSIFPGEGNWGEKAAFAVRPVLTEHYCDCKHHDVPDQPIE